MMSFDLERISQGKTLGRKYVWVSEEFAKENEELEEVVESMLELKRISQMKTKS